TLLVLLDFGDAQAVLTGEDLNVGDGQVHQQDGEGYALRHGAQEPDAAGDDAQAQAEDQLALGGGGRGHIVSGHEEGAQQQAAGEQLIDGVLPRYQGQHRHGGQIGHGDGGADDLGADEEEAANENGDG